MEIARAYFLRISVVGVEGQSLYYVLNDKETILSQAQKLDESLSAWRKTASPDAIADLPFKDNICTRKCLPTTCVGPAFSGGFTQPLFRPP